MKARFVPRLTAPTLFLAVWGSLAAGQMPSEEIGRLRQMLELPDSVTISVAAAPYLPMVEPTKLFIATGLELGVRQNFLQWVDEWNRKDARKHGLVLVVNNAASADVILARLVDRERARTGTATSLGTGTVYDPWTQTFHTVPYAQGYSYTTVPVFAYVLSQPSRNSFEIVWRYAATTLMQEGKDSGKQLWEDFKSLMKTRTNRGR